MSGVAGVSRVARTGTIGPMDHRWVDQDGAAQGGAYQGGADQDGDVQLALLEGPEPVWRLDDHTREVGRQGVAAARAVLRRSIASDPGTDAETSQAA